MNTTPVVLQVLSAEAADPREIEHAAIGLRRELDCLRDVDTELAMATPPLYAKAAGVTEIGQFVLTLLGSGGVAVGLVAALKDWLMRNRRMKVRIKNGDVELELDVAALADLPVALASVQKILQAAPPNHS